MVTWTMRELEDCRNDLKNLAKAMVQTLEERSYAGCSTPWKHALILEYCFLPFVVKDQRMARFLSNDQM